MAGKLLQDCTDCQPCAQDCCCPDVGFTVCADISDICTPPNVTPPDPPNCMFVGTLFFGWNTVPQCILDLANGGTITYDVFLHACPSDMSGTPDFTVTNPIEVACGTPAFGIGRPVWAGLAAAECGNCLPNVCLRISADGVLIARCTICPDLCDLQCSLSSSSSSESASEFSSSSASSGSSTSESESSSASSSSGGGGGGGSSSSSSSESESGDSSSSSSASESDSGSGSANGSVGGESDSSSSSDGDDISSSSSS